jgi:uncharacterized protein
MIDTNAQALVAHRLDKSGDAIRAAEYMLDRGMLIFAMNRIYYALYYAVQGLLALHGVSFSKHGQVKGYFNREFIKSGKLPKDLGRIYNKAFEFRQKYDYVDFTSPSKEMISDYIAQARISHGHIRDYIDLNP